MISEDAVLKLIGRLAIQNEMLSAQLQEALSKVKELSNGPAEHA